MIDEKSILLWSQSFNCCWLTCYRIYCRGIVGLISNISIRRSLLTFHTETCWSIKIALLMIIAHAITTNFWSVAYKVTFKLFEGFIQGKQIVTVKIHVSFSSIYQLGHWRWTKVRSSSKSSQRWFSMIFLKEYCHSKISKDQLSLRRTIENILRFDISMNYLHRMHQQHFTHQFFLALLQVKSFLHILKVICNWLAKLHFEFNAVVEAN